ncbi:hypothetical protein GJ699_05330 [Duganella sp. FT80W]|uniref:Uncharacterized protein n=1 Tax=Duganella guangzhouensis TaxID=2666084 RepID=A0A6I2KU73_9BURK|nr:hypothetical protein [Duganella guangzhouensis]MRW89398.1 hypothetical protein [Duganella guangzhouensis]
MELITSKLIQLYQGEQFDDRAQWHAGNGPVRYLDAIERLQYRIRIAGGLLWDVTGTQLDTSNGGLGSDAMGHAIYVLDAMGNLYCSGVHQYYRFHHSSFVAGAPVACAGEIDVLSGMLIYLNNRSGHYLPSTLQLRQFCEYLRSMGIECPDVENFDGDFQS